MRPMDARRRQRGGAEGEEREGGRLGDDYKLEVTDVYLPDNGRSIGGPAPKYPLRVVKISSLAHEIRELQAAVDEQVCRFRDRVILDLKQVVCGWVWQLNWKPGVEEGRTARERTRKKKVYAAPREVWQEKQTVTRWTVGAAQSKVGKTNVDEKLTVVWKNCKSQVCGQLPAVCQRRVCQRDILNYVNSLGGVENIARKTEGPCVRTTVLVIGYRPDDRTIL